MSSNMNAISNEQAKELLDAQVLIRYHMLGFLNTMALKCALELGIADVIHKHGKPICVTDLINSLAIHPTKTSSFHRLMRHLCHLNLFTQKHVVNNNEPLFQVNTNSLLLLKHHPLSQASFVSLLDTTMTNSAHYFSRWLTSDEISPFNIAHGTSIWEHASFVGNVNFNKLFNEAMASDTRLVASLLTANNESKSLFEGIESLVDVGGGTGTMAKAIVKAYPGLFKCIVLDLPHVVDGLSKDNTNKLVFVAGDMFEAIPQAHAVLLKCILHDWSDEHCVKILKNCKEAISIKNPGGKVIIIDMVLDNQSDDDGSYYHSFKIVSDMEMMAYTIGGKERTEEEWKNLFFDAGFSTYKIFNVLGPRSIIEVYP